MLLTESSPQPYDTKLADVWSLGVLITVCVRNGRRMWEAPEPNDAGFAKHGLNANRRHVKLGTSDELACVLDMALVEVGQRGRAAEMVALVDQLGGPAADWWAQRRA